MQTGRQKRSGDHAETAIHVLGDGRVEGAAGLQREEVGLRDQLCDRWIADARGLGYRVEGSIVAPERNVSAGGVVENVGPVAGEAHGAAATTSWKSSR